MNFQVNKNKKMEQNKLKILILGASVLCLSDQEKFFMNVTEKLFGMAKTYTVNNVEYIECLQMKLKMSQANLRILRNFNYELTDEDINFCEDAPEIEQIINSINQTEKRYGRFNELSCGALNSEKTFEYVINFVVLATISDEEEVNYELETLAHKIREQAGNIVDCLRNNIERQGKPVFL